MLATFLFEDIHESWLDRALRFSLGMTEKHH